MPRKAVAPVAVIAAIVLWAARADAHATFVGAPSTVAADADVALTMNVPHERGSGPYNVGVTIALPSGWRSAGCQAQASWTCAAGTDAGRAVVRFTKDAGAARAQDETFHITLHSGTSGGVAAFPTVQTYNTGEIVRWIESPGSAFPAPTLTVAGNAPAPTAATSAAPAPATTTRTTVPRATTTATTVPATDAPVTTAASTSTSTTVAATTATTIEVATTVPVASTSAETSTTPGPSTSVTASGGGGTVLAVGIVLALTVAAGAGVWVYRRRQAR